MVLYSIDEAARHCNKGYHSVWQALKDGRVKGQKAGCHYCLTPENVEELREYFKTAKRGKPRKKAVA